MVAVFSLTEFLGGEYWMYNNADNEEYMNVFLTFWDTVADRYEDSPNNAVSFNILNESTDWFGEERYCELILEVAGIIRSHTPKRLIIADMYEWGREQLYGLVGSGIVQSIHCYQPSDHIQEGAVYDKIAG